MERRTLGAVLQSLQKEFAGYPLSWDVLKLMNEWLRLQPEWKDGFIYSPAVGVEEVWHFSHGSRTTLFMDKTDNITHYLGVNTYQKETEEFATHFLEVN